MVHFSTSMTSACQSPWTTRYGRRKASSCNWRPTRSCHRLSKIFLVWQHLPGTRLPRHHVARQPAPLSTTRAVLVWSYADSMLQMVPVTAARQSRRLMIAALKSWLRQLMRGWQTTTTKHCDKCQVWHKMLEAGLCTSGKLVTSPTSIPYFGQVSIIILLSNNVFKPETLSVELYEKRVSCHSFLMHVLTRSLCWAGCVKLLQICHLKMLLYVTYAMGSQDEGHIVIG